jgi:hypothetical protein
MQSCGGVQMQASALRAEVIDILSVEPGPERLRYRQSLQCINLKLYTLNGSYYLETEEKLEK